MNCLDFRRLCLVEPGNREPRVFLHLYHCAACRSYRKRVIQAEREMTAVMHVPVPEGLGSKIVFDTELHAQREDKQRFNWMAMAASIVLGVAIGVGLFTMTTQPDVLPSLAMHVADDPLHMTPAQPDADQRLDEVMRFLGGAWAGAKPRLTHAKLCLVDEHAAAHLVVAGKQGPVTVFLLPRSHARTLQNRVVDGQIAEVAALNTGSIALFGYRGEDLAAIERQFQASVTWSDVVAQQKTRFLVLGY